MAAAAAAAAVSARRNEVGGGGNGTKQGGHGAEGAGAGAGRQSLGERAAACLRDYFLGFVPPHIRRKGIRLPPLRVRYHTLGR